MRLPWDKNYIKIIFHGAVAFLIIYILKIMVDSLAFTITNLTGVFQHAIRLVGKVISVFAPLVAAFALAYILDPLVDFFQRKYEAKANFFNKRKTRFAGTVTVYLLMVIMIIGAGVYTGIAGLSDFLSQGTEIFSSDSTDIHNLIESFAGGLGISTDISDVIDSIAEQLNKFVESIRRNLSNGLKAVGSGLITMLAALVIGFYFLKDKAAIKARCCYISEAFLPKKIDLGLRSFLADIHMVFSGYIRGQLIDILIVWILISVSLSIIGVKHAVIIGLISGLSNIIPYFGVIISLVLSAVAAFISGGTSAAIAATVVVFVLQQIDAMFILPKVVGKKVELGAVTVILSVIVAGNLFGFAGMIFATPVTASVKLFLMRLTERRKKRKENEL